jgi:hypothetical protein
MAQVWRPLRRRSPKAVWPPRLTSTWRGTAAMKRPRPHFVAPSAAKQWRCERPAATIYGCLFMANHVNRVGRGAEIAYTTRERIRYEWHPSSPTPLSPPPSAAYADSQLALIACVSSAIRPACSMLLRSGSFVPPATAQWSAMSVRERRCVADWCCDGMCAEEILLWGFVPEC